MASNNAAAPAFGKYERMLALRYLFAKRSQGGVALIAIISVIAITFAVFVLIATMSIMNGFREELLSRIVGVKGHIYVSMQGRTPDEVNTLIRRAEATPDVVAVAPIVQGQALAMGQGEASGAFVLGVRPQDLAHMPMIAKNITGGSLGAFGANEDGASVLIGSRLADSLGAHPGSIITLLSPQGAVTPFGVAPRKKAYDTAGTFSVDVSEYDSTVIYMPLEEAELFFSRAGPDILELRVKNPDDTDTVMRALRMNLGNEVYIYDWKTENKPMVNALEVERVMMALILMMVVAIAALNIICGVVMLVKNKARDVAILRTIGATRGSVLRIFLMAGALLGFLGVIAGIVLAVLFCVYIGTIQDFVAWIMGVNVFDPHVYSMSRIPAKVHVAEVAFVAFFAFAMSFLWALIPAWWASRMDPVEALRYE